MNFEELRRIQRILKQLKELKALKDLIRGMGRSEKQEACEQWLTRHREDVRQIDQSELDSLRETAEYDEVEWAKLLSQLKTGDFPKKDSHE